MDKEIIELLKSLAGNAEILVIWYMVLQFASVVVSWVGAVCCLFWFGRGISWFSKKLDQSK